MKTGNQEHPGDILYNATLQIQPEFSISSEKVPKEYTEADDGFYSIDQFSNSMGSVFGLLNFSIVGNIKKIRIVIPNQNENWIIIREIDFVHENRG